MYGSLVREVRKSRGLSQRELAEVSGIRQANISAIENNRREPSAETLNRLLVACGYQLAAVAGERVIACALPMAGWFPDEDLPVRLPDDPPDQPADLDDGPVAVARAQLVADLLDAVDAVTSSR